MVNRTGTYIAFDGLGETNPTKSDFRYYSTIQAWNLNKRVAFRFRDSHSATYAIRDTSTVDTVKSRIRERLSGSKNCLIILSDKTRKTGSMLSYEIEKAVDYYNLPLIVAYPGYTK
ncbi:hypothetical protein N9K16_03765, partial [Alphaproteobacteria bacterium]|nr:hypothetical protein [Alphaproteobacteria bacterium]